MGRLFAMNLWMRLLSMAIENAFAMFTISWDRRVRARSRLMLEKTQQQPTHRMPLLFIQRQTQTHRETDNNKTTHITLHNRIVLLLFNRHSIAI